MKSKALKKVIENYDISRVVDQHVEMFNSFQKSKRDSKSRLISVVIS